MSAGRICNRIIATAAPDEMIREAARRMDENGVGTLISLDDERHPIGMVTDRDIALRCVARKLDPETTPIAEIMTRPVQSVPESLPIEEAVGRMASAGVRRLVVTDENNHAVGVLALDDVLELLIEETDTIGKLLRKQEPKITA